MFFHRFQLNRNITQDLVTVKIMSEVVCTKSQEEYEDDFEKDLDWLINEESRSEDQASQASLCSVQFTCIRSQTDSICSLCFLLIITLLFLFYCVKLNLECCSTYCRLVAAWVPDPAP